MRSAVAPFAVAHGEVDQHLVSLENPLAPGAPRASMVTGAP